MALQMAALKRSTTGAFVARKVIPKDIRAEYAARYGVGWEEKFHRKSEISEHEAKARFGEWLAEIETRIGQLRATKAAGPQPLSRQNAYALAGRWYAWFIGHHKQNIRTPGHWKALADNLVWDVIRPQAPEEYEAHPDRDRSWDWKAQPDIREATRPAIATEAKIAAFLTEQNIALTPDATNLLVDAVSDNLLDAFGRLESLARGDYAPDQSLASFPQLVEVSQRSSARVGVKSLFEQWAKAIQPATSTIDRWSTVFNAADTRFQDAVDIDFTAARIWLNGTINETRSAHTVATVWRTALKTVFSWGITEELIKSNPFRNVRISVPRKNIERETKAFTQEEAKIILSASTGCDDT